MGKICLFYALQVASREDHCSVFYDALSQVDVISF